MDKVGGFSALWDRLRDIVYPKARKAKKDVQEHFSSEDPKKWDQFVAKSPDSEFLRQLEKNKQTDPKLLLHARQMGNLKTGPTLGTVISSSGPGSYEIKSLPNGMVGCTCNDWRFKGSVTPGYKCKHIKAYEQGLSKAASFNASTLGFFDELRKIREAIREDAYEEQKASMSNTAQPYSNLLRTNKYFDTASKYEETEPEVITGGGWL